MNWIGGKHCWVTEVAVLGMCGRSMYMSYLSQTSEEMHHFSSQVVPLLLDCILIPLEGAD